MANLPAEITHLLEEVSAKDQQIEDLRNLISSRDRSIQNFVRSNGGHVKNPKEDGLARAIISAYDKIEILQAEKLALSEKAMIVLDRQIKRFDLKMRKLESNGEIQPDPNRPSLIQPGASISGTPTGTSTPLAGVAGGPLTINTAHSGGAPNIANAAQARMAANNSSARSSPISAPNPLLNQAHLNGPGTSIRTSRETSADAAKRRRLTSSHSGAIPTMSSALRQSSTGPTGPGTPKAGTPAPSSSSRAGSASAQSVRPAGAATKKASGAPTNKKIAPHQAAAARKRIRPSAGSTTSAASGSTPTTAVGGPGGTAVSTTSALKKDSKRRTTTNLSSPTPSSSRGSVSPTPSSLPQTDGASDSVSRGGAATATAAASRRNKNATASDDEANDHEQDAEGDEIYCVCQQVSYGDMVACDNEECPYQWFHWTCVGLKAEPKGDWLCPHCSDLPSDKIVKAKDEK